LRFCQEEGENKISNNVQDGNGFQGVISVCAFTWYDMSNYVGHREQFLSDSGHQIEVKYVTWALNASLHSN
jgi:hypothetical protein